MSPLSEVAFLQEIWERKPLVLRRTPDHLDALGIDKSWFDRIRSEYRLRARDVRLVQDGARRSPVCISNADEVDARALDAAIADGATLIIDRIDRLWPAFSALSQNLEDALTHPVAINLYVTPAGAQGFAPHFDHHDVFIVQLAGRKHWRVSEPCHPLPLATAPPLSPSSIARPLLLEAELSPGDLLYVVRGSIHEARAADEVSMHITIGIHCIRWVDALKEAVRAWALQATSARRGLPPEANQEQWAAEQLQEMVRSFVDEASFARARDRLVEQFLDWTTPDFDGAPEGPDARVAVDRGTPLRFKRRFGGRLVELKDGMYFRVAGGQWRVEPADLVTWRFLAGVRTFRWADIPGPQAAVERALADLTEAGCLEAIPPEPTADDQQR